MSFFSRSSRRKPYKYGKHGHQHYQKKGLMGKLFDMLGSRSHSNKRYHTQHNPSYSKSNPSSNQGGIGCRKCHAQIPTGSKFCLECGEKVNTSLFCGNCGETLPPNAKFCPSCGTKSGG
ncbi:zinc ribbon domain-containing protein [Bacillus niameyensis]|uniref:zinc ribbon domain-containing protein n=1 Tax=Bacillus niameyensis TaxID=1522308 RepID=UPI000781B7CD|nr:zinc ribbon domain-containing protein [Bacillus niameyensis]